MSHLVHRVLQGLSPEGYMEGNEYMQSSFGYKRSAQPSLERASARCTKYALSDTLKVTRRDILAKTLPDVPCIRRSDSDIKLPYPS